MYVLVQGAVPKYNSAQCVTCFLFSSTNYSANLTNMLYSYKIISIVNVNISIHIYMLLCNHDAVYVHFIYNNTMHYSSV